MPTAAACQRTDRPVRPDASPDDESSASSDRQPQRGLWLRVSRSFAAWARWLHIYLSMIGFTVLLFFSVTGITLNHPQWFPAGDATENQTEGHLDPKLLGVTADGTIEDAERVDRLQVTEHLRNAHHIRAALADFSIDDTQCVVVFKGPSYAADAFIDRSSGDYQLTESYQGLVALVNDLHKGRDTGTGWSWLIDISAILMTLVSLTGFVLIFYIRRRRLSGLVMAGVGTVAAFGVYWFCVK